MDTESQKRFDEIVRKEVAALTDDEKGFLRARSSYLNDEQRHRFAEVLNEDAPPSNIGAPDLTKLSKAKLTKLAKDLGLDPKDFESQEALIAAIQAKQAEAQNSQ